MVTNYRPIGRAGMVEAKRQTIQVIMDRLYKDKQFDLVRTIELPVGQVFMTKMGRPCRRGYVIRDRATGEQQGVGETLLRIIHDRYHAVPLPPRFFRRDPIRRQRQRHKTQTD
jgi:hypothetical protein